eukprot:COSAG06_NODE_3860_length_4823_cov_4.086367_2_plen_89_part_00
MPCDPGAHSASSIGPPGQRSGNGHIVHAKWTYRAVSALCPPYSTCGSNWLNFGNIVPSSHVIAHDGTHEDFVRAAPSVRAQTMRLVHP